LSPVLLDVFTHLALSSASVEDGQTGLWLSLGLVHSEWLSRTNWDTESSVLPLHVVACVPSLVSVCLAVSVRF